MLKQAEVMTGYSCNFAPSKFQIQWSVQCRTGDANTFVHKKVCTTTVSEGKGAALQTSAGTGFFAVFDSSHDV